MASIVARRWPTVSAPECIFDQIVAGTRPAHVVLDEPDLVAFLDIRPVFEGHTLVIPRTHAETIAGLPAGLLGPLLEAGRRVAGAQRAALGAEGTFFALNDVVSQSVPHVHLHVVPRRRGDGLRGFFWPRSSYPDEAAAAVVAEQLRHALEPASDPAATEGAGARPDFVVRLARPDDTPALAALLAGGSLRGGEDPADLAVYQAAMDDIVRTPGNDVLVAEAGGSVAGMCQLITFRHLQQRGGRCAEIESMHVDEGLRSSGIGGALLEAAVQLAREAGCYRVQLTSNKSRAAAHRFYLRHGFEASHQGFKRYLT